LSRWLDLGIKRFTLEERSKKNSIKYNFKGVRRKREKGKGKRETGKGKREKGNGKREMEDVKYWQCVSIIKIFLL
jgi:hypothetical protein